MIFIKLWSDVHLSKTICKTYESICVLKVKVKIKVHDFEPLIFCPLHISFTPGGIIINR